MGSRFSSFLPFFHDNIKPFREPGEDVPCLPRSEGLVTMAGAGIFLSGPAVTWRAAILPESVPVRGHVGGIKTQVPAAMLGWVLKGRTPAVLGGAQTPRTCLLTWRTCVGGGVGSWLLVILSLASHGNFLSVRWVCDNTFLPPNPATVSVGPHEFTSEVHTSCPSPAAPHLAGSS